MVIPADRRFIFPNNTDTDDSRNRANCQYYAGGRNYDRNYDMVDGFGFFHYPTISCHLPTIADKGGPNGFHHYSTTAWQNRVF